MTVISPRTEEPFRQLFRDTAHLRQPHPEALCRLLRRSAADKKAREPQQWRQRCKLRCKFARRTGVKGRERGSMRGTKDQRDGEKRSIS